jgi:hypothetical protein
MLDDLLVEARGETRRGEDQDEGAVRRAADALAERLQREVELFLRGRSGSSTPDA